ncbi:hypothetical protein ACOAKC_08450 [Hathewaya histolytica]|uniref:hypothetical protein n=1 Tax=Hathewaya histolytica TaxID=1498 RepID=UPI003B67CECC
MKNDLKFLIKVNLLNYLSDFLFVFFYSRNKEILEADRFLLGFWFLTPLIFLTITSFILATDNKEEYKIFKIEARLDYIIRVCACFVAFYNNFNFEFLSKSHIVQQSILGILFMLSLVLEYIMYKKAKNHKLTNKKVQNKYKLSEAEKFNIRKMGNAVAMGLSSFIAYAALGINLPLFASIHNKKFKILIVIVSITTFIWFLNFNYKKCTSFYLDKGLAKRTFRKEAKYVILGYCIYLLTVLNVFKYLSDYGVITFLVLLLCLYPVIRTNRKMALRYREMMEVLGDDFEYYYTHGD